jgi:hypothetical protein
MVYLVFGTLKRLALDPADSAFIQKLLELLVGKKMAHWSEKLDVASSLSNATLLGRRRKQGDERALPPHCDRLRAQVAHFRPSATHGK